MPLVAWAVSAACLACGAALRLPSRRVASGAIEQLRSAGLLERYTHSALAGLQSSSSFAGRLVMARLGEVVVVAVDTGPAGASPLARTCDVEVLGAGRNWTGLQMKSQLLAEFVGATAEREPEQVVVLVDGSDVLFGGCSGDELLRHFQSTVDATGAKVVLGAELGAYPDEQLQSLDGNRTFQDKMRAVLSAHHLPDRPYTAYTGCKMPREPGNWGQCSEPPRYQFVNSGFYMGRARDLVPVLEAIRGGRDENDQVNAVSHQLQNPDTVVLDYSGALVLNLHEFKDVDSLLKVERRVGTREGMAVRNAVTGNLQCFVHGNGWGKRAFELLSRRLLSPS